MKYAASALALTAALLATVYLAAAFYDVDTTSANGLWGEVGALLALGLGPLAIGILVLNARFWRRFIPSGVAACCALAAVLAAGWGAWSKLRPSEVDAQRSAKPATPGALDPEKQRYIWRTEHVTFKVETYVAKPLVAALRDRSFQRLASYFRTPFAGRVLKREPVAAQTHSLITQRRCSAADNRSVPGDANDVINALLELARPFDRIDRASLRVLKIDEAQQTQWRLQMLLSLAGRDASGGLLDCNSMHQVVMQIDDDQSFTGEKSICGWQMESVTTYAAPRPVMEEVTEAVGLDKLDLRDNWRLATEDRFPYPLQMAVEDFDGDGFVDVAVATFDKHYLLRSEQGKSFRDVAPLLLPGRWQWMSHLVAWFDFDNDGDPDLLLRDRLLRNDDGESFTDVTALSGLNVGYSPMGCAIADYDGDGRLDVYICYADPPATVAEHGPWVGDTHSGTSNRLWRNEGHGSFRDVTDESGTAGGRRHSFAAAWLYYDEDEWPDLYVANDFGSNTLLRNRGDGTFEDVSDSCGATGFSTSMGVCAGDLTGDGMSELYISNMYSKMGRRIIAHIGDEDYPPGVFAQIRGSCAGSELYTRGDTPGTFREISNRAGVNAVGWAYGSAMADFDSDGRLDIYATAGHMSFRRDKPDG